MKTSDKPTRAEEILNKTCEGHLKYIPRHQALEAMEQYRTEGLREELIKYDKEIYYDIHTEETSEIIVDEYLYLKQKGSPL